MQSHFPTFSLAIMADPIPGTPRAIAKNEKNKIRNQKNRDRIKKVNFQKRVRPLVAKAFRKGKEQGEKGVRGLLQDRLRAKSKEAEEALQKSNRNMRAAAAARREATAWEQQSAKYKHQLEDRAGQGWVRLSPSTKRSSRSSVSPSVPGKSC